MKEILHSHRQRFQLVGGDKDAGEDVVIPRQDEGEDGGGDDPRQGQRQHHVEHRPHPSGPVHQRGLLQLDGDGLEERPHEPEGEGEAERRQGQHQGEVRILDSDLLHQDEEGDHHHDGGEHVGAQDQPGDLLATGVMVPGEAVGPGRADGHGQEDDQPAHGEAVPEVREEIRAGE